MEGMVAIRHCPHHEHARRILEVTVSKEENSFPAEKPFESGRPRHGRNRDRILRESMGILCLRNKAHLLTYEEILIEHARAPFAIRIELLLQRVFLHIEKDIFRNKRIEHLQHEDLINKSAAHGQRRHLRLNVERNVDVLFGEILSCSMLVIEAIHMPCMAIPEQTAESLPEKKRAHAPREKRDRMKYKLPKIFPKHSTHQTDPLEESKFVMHYHIPWTKI